MQLKTLQILLIISCWFSSSVFSQVGQLEITRVTTMPNLPSPYLMRDWRKVAVQYDSFIFNLNTAGQYLPLMHLKSSGVNYPSLQPILLDSYVGVNGSGSEAEAINIIPSVVGASLIGINKSNQFGTDWVSKTKDFFNKANGQNVYLNSYSTASGNDWWYDLMPNVFFYQLYSLYPTTVDFQSQFISVADRWLEAVNSMGASTTPWTVPQMNYRAFNLITMTPTTSSVSEPESAGTISWLLYHAYLQTGDKKYLQGAQLSMSFLSSLTSNPAYEIQLPYGTFIAAKMNAELGTTYDIQKMLNWSFDLSAQRNWGTIVGTWGNAAIGLKDVSGLVGEIDNPATGYAFAMNGFEQAAALVPLIKYDKRFARTIAKWVLNLANASRLFYAPYLPASHQDGYLWSSLHDLNAVIGYEALKQTGLNDSSLYATGDALRTGGGQTNLGLYGSSHVGYLGSLIKLTEVEGILLLDLNKTDFFGQNSFPSYAVYNPYSAAKQITLALGSSAFDLYDAISETTLAAGATGNFQITVPANQVILLVYLPAGSSPLASNGKLYQGNKVVDYHYGYTFKGSFRIQSLAAKDSVVEFNQKVFVYSSVRNNTAAVTFKWYLNNTLIQTSTDSILHWTVPSVSGKQKLLLTATDNGITVKDSILFRVVNHLIVAPIIKSIELNKSLYYADSVATIICHASTLDGSGLVYKWSGTYGAFLNQTDSVLQWKAPLQEGLYSITCLVKNADSLSASTQQLVLVKSKTDFINGPVAYFPLDGDTRDYSGNNHHASSFGVQLTKDARDNADKAYSFTASSNIIDVPNETSLNFQNAITLSFWLKLDAVPAESYILSHGSYQQRWKISVIPSHKIRWTVKTGATVKDLDSSFPLELNHFYHFTMVYSGYSMELYVNGVLDTYIQDAGLISVASDDITFGRPTASIKNYSLFGTLDEVRMYDRALGPNEIVKLPTIWSDITEVSDLQDVVLFPNPSTGVFYVHGINGEAVAVEVSNMVGDSIRSSFEVDSNGSLEITMNTKEVGVLLVTVKTMNGILYHLKIVLY